MSDLPEPTLALSPEQIAFYNENGYLAIDSITKDDEILSMCAAYDDLFDRRAGREEGMEFDLAGTDEDHKKPKLPQILEPRNYSEALKNTQYESNALNVATQLLDEGIVLRGSHAICKPAGYGAATPWHQDEAYWSPKKNYHSISIWMPLQEATLENGCSISHRKMSPTLREGHLSSCSTYPSRHRKRLATSIGKKASIHTRPKNGKQPIPDRLRHLLGNIQTEGEYR